MTFIGASPSFSFIDPPSPSLKIFALAGISPYNKKTTESWNKIHLKKGVPIKPTSPSSRFLFSLGKTILLFLVYFQTAKLGLQLDSVAGFATLVWAPAGIAMAAIFLGGLGLWPGVILGALAANYQAGAPLGVAVVIALGNTLECLVGAYFLRNWGGKGRPGMKGSTGPLTTLQGILVLIFLSSMLAPLLSSVIGTCALFFSGTIGIEKFLLTWVAWWLGDMMAIVILVPLLIFWFHRPFPSRIPSLWRTLEISSLLTLFTLLVYAIFQQEGPLNGRYLQIYFTFPFLLWMATRFDRSGIVFLNFLLAGISIWGTAQGKGPFAAEFLSGALIHLQNFLIMFSMTGLVLAAVVSELQSGKERLETTIKALELNQSHMHRFLESALDPIIGLDQDGNIQEFNPAAVNAFHYEKADAKDKNFSDLLVPDTFKEIFKHEFEKLMGEGGDTVKRNSFEWTVKRASGETFPAEISILSIRDNGEGAFLVHLRDISDRRDLEKAKEAAQLELETKVEKKTTELARVNEELKKGKWQLEEAQRMAHIGSFEWDMATDHLNGSRELFMIYGLDPLEFKGNMEGLMNLVHPEDRYRAQKVMTQALHETKDLDFEHRIIRSDSSLRVLQGRLKVIRDILGGPMKMIGTAQDITERKRAQEERERFFNLSLDMMCIATMDGHFKKVNGAFEKTLGYSREELLSDPFLYLIHPEDQATTLEEMKALAMGAPSFNFQNRYRCKGGQYKWLAWTTYPLPEEKLLYAVARDITEKKEVDEKIKASLREKDTLLKEIHHRVKNNLQITSSLLRLQADKTNNQEAKEIFLESEGRLKSMALVHEKLYQSKDLTKIDFGDYVGDLVGHVTKSYISRQKDIRILTEIDRVFFDIDVAIPCALILNELVVNSIKHAFPKGGTDGEILIKIQTVSILQGDRAIILPEGKKLVQICIVDNGSGFPQGKNFHDYTSLGLKLVVNLTQQLKGRIEQIPVPRGTKFEITVPLPHPSVPVFS